MDTKEMFAQMSAQDAQMAMTGAYLNPETPEETAKRFRKARAFDVLPTQAEAITPEQEAARRAQDVDWLAMQACAPVLTEMLSQPAMANLYKDNLTNASIVERMMYKLSPDEGEKEGLWGTVRNTLAESLFRTLHTTPIFGRQASLDGLQADRDRIDDLWARIQAGEDVSSAFATAEDPTGQVGLAAFKVDYDRQVRVNDERQAQVRDDIARANQFAGLFPPNEAVRRFQEAKTIDEAMSALGDAPGQIIVATGFGSLIQNAPMLLATGLASGGGVLAQMGASFLTSFLSDREASMVGNLAEDLGVDWTNAESIRMAYSDPERREKVAKAADKARNHALATAAFDALSVGMASKSLVPKSVTRELFDTAAKKEFGNMALQMPLQGAMGGAGEAAGQLASDGEITSWSDVIAEIIGEQFTAPVEVATTGLKVRMDAVRAQQAAERQQEAAKALTDALNTSQVGQLDPDTQDEHIRRVADAAGITEASIDAEALQQLGLDKALADEQAIADQFANALATGGEIKVDAATFARMLRKAGPELMGITSLKQEAAPVEAQNAPAEAEEAANRETQAAEARAEAERGFRSELAEVGVAIGKQIRETGVTRKEASGLQAIIQAAVGAAARDARVSPKALWEKYGFRILSGDKVDREGLDSFLQDTLINVPEEFGPVFSEFRGDVPSALAKLRAEKNGAVPGLYHHKQVGDIGLAYGNRKYGLVHIDTKHPGIAERLQEILDSAEVDETLTKDLGQDRMILRDAKHRVLLALRWMGKEDSGSWVLTAYREESSDAQHNLPTAEVAGEGGQSLHPSEAAPSLPSLSQNAKGEFFPSINTIVRWKSADRSTLLHETAHAFLQMRFAIAQDLMEAQRRSVGPLTEGQTALLQSVQATLDWFGVKDLAEWNAMSVDEQRKHHEKFARSFEAYVMEGRAPTRGLRRVFHNFARWLQTIYSVIANIPGAEMDPEVREMFDAMFLARDQVREAVIRQNSQMMFTSAEEAGMTPEEWAAYSASRSEIVKEAEAELTARNARLAKRVLAIRRRIEKELRAEGKNASKEARERMEQKVRQTQTWKVWDILRNGTEKDGKPFKPKLFFGDLEMLGYSKRKIEQLHEARLASPQAFRQPISLEDLARLFDYGNANEMVDDMLAHRDMDAYIDALTTEHLLRYHPELSTRKGFDELSNVSIFNESKLDIVSAELAAMEKKLGQVVRAGKDAFEAVAYEVVNGTGMKDLKPQEHVRAANRAAKKARAAWASGDIKQAVSYKRQELYQSAMAKAAKEAKSEIAKDARNLRRYRKKEMPGVDTRFLVIAQRALANLGFFTEKQLSLNPAEKSFREELGEFEAEIGAAVDVDPELVSMIDIKAGDRIRTVGDWRKLQDFLDQLMAMGRKEKQINLLDEKMTIEAVQEKGAAEIRRVADAHKRPASVEHEEQGRKAEWTDRLRRFGLSHARASALFAVLDGATNGYLTKLVIYSSDKCATRQEQMKSEMAKDLYAIAAPVMKSLANGKKKTSKVLGYAFSASEVFTALLNYGNDGNRQRVLVTLSKLTGKDLVSQCYDKNLSADTRAEANAKADLLMSAFFQEYLTDEHFAAAQKIWNKFAEVQKLTDKTARSITGRSPVWVQPREVVINDRIKLAGGYYPIVYDRKLDLRSNGLAGLQSEKGLHNVFHKSGVDDGHLQSRVGYVDAGVTLVPRGMFEGLENQIQYICWAPWVNDMRKVMSPKGAIRQAIHERYGNDYDRAIMDWLEVCRTGTGSQADNADIIADTLRKGVSLAGVGFNLSTAGLQLVGITQSIAYLGGRWTGRGIAEFMRLGPTGSFKWVAGKSEMMQARMRTQFRELTEIQTRLQGNTGTLKDKMMRAAYMPLTVMQMAVDLPTWMGAYQKALSEGQTEELAVAEADRAVMNAQGSGRVTDLSAVERGSPWMKLFTVFYTFFNTALNLGVISGQTKPMMKAAADIAMICVMQPVLETFLKSAASNLLSDDSDDDWMEKMLADAGQNVIQFNLGMLMGVRELSWIAGDFGYQGPTGLRKITDTGKAIRAWEKAISEGEWDESTMRATVSAMGVWMGWPVTPINRFISGTNALLDDQTDSWFAPLTGYSEKK